MWVPVGVFKRLGFLRGSIPSDQGPSTEADVDQVYGGTKVGLVRDLGQVVDPSNGVIGWKDLDLTISPSSLGPEVTDDLWKLLDEGWSGTVDQGVEV